MNPHITVNQSALAEIIMGEARWLARDTEGAVELDDLVNEGWLTALTARSELGLPGLRLRIRGAMKDTLRRERRATGSTDAQIFWPVYWPKKFHAPGQVAHQNYRKPYTVRRCLDCRAYLEPLPNSNRKRCPPCVVEHKRVINRERRKVA